MCLHSVVEDHGGFEPESRKEKRAFDVLEHVELFDGFDEEIDLEPGGYSERDSRGCVKHEVSGMTLWVGVNTAL